MSGVLKLIQLRLKKFWQPYISQSNIMQFGVLAVKPSA